MSDRTYASDWANVKSPTVRSPSPCRTGPLNNLNSIYSQEESYYATPIFNGNNCNGNVNANMNSNLNNVHNISDDVPKSAVPKNMPDHSFPCYYKTSTTISNGSSFTPPTGMKESNGSDTPNTVGSGVGLLLPYKKKRKEGFCCFGLLTRCECFLLLSCLLLFLLLCSIFVVWIMPAKGYSIFRNGFNPWKYSDTNGQNITIDSAAIHHNKAVCTSKDCVAIASFLTSNMNPKVDPCDDFYEFACGNYPLNHDFPLNKPLTHTIYDAEAKLQRQLKTLLESPIVPTDKSWDRLVKKFYGKCIDENTLKKTAKESFISVLDEIGGWPMIQQNWIEWSHTWEYQLGDVLNKTGVNAIVLEIAVSQDPRNSESSIIEIDQPKWGMGVRWPYVSGNTAMLANYSQLMIETAMNFGCSLEKAEKEVKEIVDFELQLVNFSTDDMFRRNPDHNVLRYQLWESDNLYKNIKLGDYIKRVFTGIADITPNETIIVREQQYLKGIQFVMSNTPKRVISNYIGWRVIHAYKPFLSVNERKPFEIFRMNQTEMTSIMKLQRWDECTTYTSALLDMPVGKMFVENFFARDFAMDKMHEMTSYLKSAFMTELKNADWMDSITKERALKKAEMITYKLGYPETLFNDTWMQEYWGDKVPSDKEPILQLIIRIKGKRNIKELRRLKLPVDKSIWYQGPAQVDAFYAPNMNEMIFPAGIMQFPFLTTGAPNYINFGFSGAIIGHEVSHAFDDQGGRYDEKGNFYNWWDLETINKFYTKADCFIKQYDDIRIDEANINLNGRLSLGENLADNSGLKAAYSAYHLWMTNTSISELALPGLQEYTTDQLFFVSYANNWCSMTMPQHYKHLIMTDVHAPGKYRANTPLQNRPEFSKAYNCPLGSRMNPYKKCSVW